MAKSIRVSDGIYELAAEAGDLSQRSLADQVEYWARLGAALDAAGVTLGQVSRLLGGNPKMIEAVVAHAATVSNGARRRNYTGTASSAARTARFEAEVTSGARTPESLLILSRDRVRKANVVFAPEPGGEASGW
jgi:ParD-like antitoxin of type II bacterial toxin-antitoxin system